MAGICALLLPLALLPVSTVAGIPSDEEVLRQAAAAFRAGVHTRGSPGDAAHFKKAAAGFEELRRRGANNPDLFRDEGNAYLLAGDLPHAILSYRRGLRLAPNDTGLQAGLGYARAQVVFASSDRFGRPAVDSWPSWLPRVTPCIAWTGIVLCYGVSWVTLTRWYMTRHGWLLGLVVVAFILAIVLGGVVPGEAANHREEDRHPLVVIANDGVYLRQGNGFAYPPRYDTPLNRGVEARLRFVRGEWLQVELAGGEIGWVPVQAALVEGAQKYRISNTE